MKRAGKLPHELTREDILGASHYEGAPIANAISEVFAAYKIDQYSWTYARYVSDVAAVRYSDDLVEYQQRNPPPWDTLRDVMARMRDAAGDSGLFDFEFSDPADVRLSLSNYERFSFKTEMTNRTTGAQYEPESFVLRREDPHGLVPCFVQPAARSAAPRDFSFSTKSMSCCIRRWSQRWLKR